MKNKVQHIVINAAFLIVLFSLFLNQIIPFFTDDTNIENRSKVTKPKFDITSLDKFPDSYNNYFLDNFEPRGKFIAGYNQFNKNVFNNHILSRNYIRGNDDYLFSLSRFIKNSTLFTESELGLILENLKFRDSTYTAMGYKMLFFVVPEKSSAISDELPLFFRRDSPSRTIQTIEYIRHKSDIEIYYLLDALSDKKQKEKIFYKYDTHWSNEGTFFAYEYIAEKVNALFPETTIYNLSDFHIKDTIKTNGDIAKTLGLDLVEQKSDYIFNHKQVSKFVRPDSKYFTDEFFEYGVLMSQNVNSKLPKAIIIHDSFTIQLKPFLKNIFSSALFLWDKWKYKPHFEIVTDFDPDLVIFIMTEGGFDRFLPYMERQKYNKKKAHQ